MSGQYLIMWQLLANQVRLFLHLALYPAIQPRLWLELVVISTRVRMLATSSASSRQMKSWHETSVSLWWAIWVKPLGLVGLLVYQLYTGECLLVARISFRYRSFRLEHLYSWYGTNFRQNRGAFAAVFQGEAVIYRQHLEKIICRGGSELSNDIWLITVRQSVPEISALKVWKYFPKIWVRQNRSAFAAVFQDQAVIYRQHLEKIICRGGS